MTGEKSKGYITNEKNAGFSVPPHQQGYFSDTNFSRTLRRPSPHNGNKALSLTINLIVALVCDSL
jgi:hypothetical protein